MRILLAQMKPSFSVEENVERLKKIVEENQVDMYVFPELYLTGYLIRERMSERAISIRDPVMEDIAKLSKGKIIIFGFPESERFLYNSAAVMINGRIEVARKIYLPNFGPFEEKLYFKEGERPFIIDTEFGKIGVQICYDAFFPEVAKLQALAGADVIVNISASPITSRAMFERIIPARAIENTVFMVYVNWAGLQRTMEFWGGSMVYSPRGDLLYKAPYFEENVGVVDIYPDDIFVARELRPTLRDTRRDFFNPQYP